MFTLQLSLRYCHLTGFAALDRRRALGLPDFDTFETHDRHREFEVDEGFARAWFAPATDDHNQIDQEWLNKGEIVLPADFAQARIGELTVERAKELYVRAEMEIRINKARNGK